MWHLCVFMCVSVCVWHVCVYERKCVCVPLYTSVRVALYVVCMCTSRVSPSSPAPCRHPRHRPWGGYIRVMVCVRECVFVCVSCVCFVCVCACIVCA